MNKLILIPIFAVVAQVAYAGCCFINDGTSCTYWELDDWTEQEKFCGMFSSISLTSDWLPTPCASTTIPAGCDDGFKGGDSTVKEAMQQRRSSGSGGGGCSPDWSCTEWSACSNGYMTRGCSDDHKCGTTSPETSKTCSSRNIKDTAVSAPTAGEETTQAKDSMANQTQTDNSTGWEITTGTTGKITAQDMSTAYYVLGSVGAIVAGFAVFLGYVAAKR
jgi:hypothetical protein